MSYRCGQCGMVSEISGTCPNCGHRIDVVSGHSHGRTVVQPKDENIAEFIDFLRDIWKDGGISDNEENAIQERRERLGIDMALFNKLDLLVRQDLGLLDSERASHHIELSVGMDAPAIKGYGFTIDMNFSNRMDLDFKSVKTVFESSFLQYLGGMDEFSLSAGGTVQLNPEFSPTQASTSGAPLRLTVEVTDKYGVVRVYRPVDRIKIPIFASPGERPPGMKIFLNSASGGLSRADIEKLDPNMISELHLTASEGGLTRLDSSNDIDNAMKATSALQVGGGTMVPVGLRLDREATESLARQRRASRVVITPSPYAGTRAEQALLQISEAGTQRRIHIVSKPELTFGRPLGEADVWLGIWDDAGKPDQVTTSRISRLHFMMKYDGNNLLIRDLGSVNGTRVNGAALGEEWRIVKPRDRIEVARAILSLVVVCESNSGGAAGKLRAGVGRGRTGVGIGDAGSSRYANIRLVREKDNREEYVFLPLYMDIGSSADCPLRLGSATELNARLYYENGRYWLKNLDSANNVGIDGERLVFDAVTPLASGRTIRIGDADMTFLVKDIN